MGTDRVGGAELGVMGSGELVSGRSGMDGMGGVVVTVDVVADMMGTDKVGGAELGVGSGELVGGSSEIDNMEGVVVVTVDVVVDSDILKVEGMVGTDKVGDRRGED